MSGSGELGLERSPGGQIWTYVDWHRNPGSLLEARRCPRPLQWIGDSAWRSDLDFMRLELQSWKPARGQNVSQTGVLDWGG